MQQQANGIVHRLPFAKGLMTTLMSNDPHTRADRPLRRTKDCSFRPIQLLSIACQCIRQCLTMFALKRNPCQSVGARHPGTKCMRLLLVDQRSSSLK